MSDCKEAQKVKEYIGVFGIWITEEPRDER